PLASPSRRSEAMFEKAFPDEQSASNIVLIVQRRGAPDLEQDKKFIESVLEQGLRQIADVEGGLAAEHSDEGDSLFSDEESQSQGRRRRSIIARIRTPNAPGTGSWLISPDHQVLLVVLELTTEFLSNENWPTIARVEE